MPRHRAASDAPAQWLRPRFSSPQVYALMSTRHGGVSHAPYDSFNPRHGVGDDALAVQVNRQRLHDWLGRPSVLLNQVHGHVVLNLDTDSRAATAPLAVADASLSCRSDVACEIQVADCLPVLVAHQAGLVVAAAHAGWRGLAAGIVENTLRAAASACAAPLDEFEVWLGPCIGAAHFEVGLDVLQAFGVTAAAPGPYFVARTEPGKWLADLAGLARHRLRTLGVARVQGNDGSDVWCTYTQADQYFSYRRDGVCGRMSALIWRQ